MGPVDGTSQQSAMRLRPATAADRPILAAATLGNVNWNGPRTTADQVRADPALWHYVAPWPGPGDFGRVAQEAPRGWLGIVWLTHFTSADPGFGFVAQDIPELSLHVVEAHRGRGLGSLMLRTAIAEARRRDLRGISLSVAAGNPAMRLYARFGFQDAGRNPGTLVLWLDAAGVHS